MSPTYIVDAHHHLWDLQACHYPWLMAKGVKRFFGDPAPIQKDYLVSDYRADIGDLPVKKSVHIQVGVEDADAVKETAFVQSQGQGGLADAIVAFADLTKPDIERQLEAHGAHSRLRGIRQIVGRSAEEDAKLGTNSLLHRADFKSGLQRLAQHGLSFDLQLTPPLLRDAAKLFGDLQALPVALCHAGSPSAETRAEWAGGLKAFAQVPQSICKLSGFGMFEPGWTVETIRAKVETAIEIFGPSRIAFASNFPVDKLAAPYARVMGAYLDLTAGYSADERQAMFATTAERFYRI